MAFLPTRQPHVRQRRDLALASSTYLLFTAFPGDLDVSHDSRTLASKFGWLPLLNLAVALPQAVAQSLNTGMGVYSMTESDDEVVFLSEAGRTSVTASFSSETIVAPSDEARLAVQQFSKEARDLALGWNPELADNDNFHSLWRRS